MNPDDFIGLPTIQFVYVDPSLVGYRAVPATNMPSAFLSNFAKTFSGISGTIVAHSPVYPGLIGSIGIWYFVPDSGLGMIIPVFPFDVCIIGKK